MKNINKITNNEIEKIVQTRMENLGITDAYSKHFFIKYQIFIWFKLIFF